MIKYICPDGQIGDNLFDGQLNFGTLPLKNDLDLISPTTNKVLALDSVDPFNNTTSTDSQPILKNEFFGDASPGAQLQQAALRIKAQQQAQHAQVTQNMLLQKQQQLQRQLQEIQKQQMKQQQQQTNTQQQLKLILQQPVSLPQTQIVTALQQSPIVTSTPVVLPHSPATPAVHNVSHMSMQQLQQVSIARHKHIYVVYVQYKSMSSQIPPLVHVEDMNLFEY